MLQSGKSAISKCWLEAMTRGRNEFRKAVRLPALVGPDCRHRLCARVKCPLQVEGGRPDDSFKATPPSMRNVSREK